MNVYLINNTTNRTILFTNDVIAVYNRELHCRNQKTAKFIADSLSESIVHDLESGVDSQITYAADIANAVVIPQKNIAIVVSIESRKDLEDDYYDYSSTIAMNKTFNS